ncbi:uncharacterized protein IUM83_11488 [Phytophthora cinnamomi]|uniref:uncharacterized protein n=1 Tax=Phytophthora cinnamomi TaxID=4785 RepID=UPI00355AB0C2|nr:hypothetical protein IUM83_11488 [Phytophthora cinnamomi]
MGRAGLWILLLAAPSHFALARTTRAIVKETPKSWYVAVAEKCKLQQVVQVWVDVTGMCSHRTFVEKAFQARFRSATRISLPEWAFLRIQHRLSENLCIERDSSRFRV